MWLSASAAETLKPATRGTPYLHRNAMNNDTGHQQLLIRPTCYLPQLDMPAIAELCFTFATAMSNYLHFVRLV
jgi:hypothetical protein